MCTANLSTSNQYPTQTPTAMVKHISRYSRHQSGPQHDAAAHRMLSASTPCQGK